MKILLLETVAKVGQRGDIVDVSDGYALNFLIPHKKATLADKEVVAQIHRTQEERARRHAETDTQRAADVRTLDNAHIEISAPANEHGQLFAGIHTRDIAAAIKKSHHIAIAPETIVFDQTIKTLGAHHIKIMGGGETATLTLEVRLQER